MERLYSSISGFDREWVKRCVPAAEEQIQQLQDIKELSDEMDRPNAYGCLCAMEEFCGGTDFTVLATKYIRIFENGMVLFEKDGEQYVCAIGEACTSFTICDMAVWEKLE